MKQTASIQVPTRLLGTPLLVSRTEADLILAALSGPLPTGIILGFPEDQRLKTYEVKDGVAILPVMGGLIYRGYGWYWRSTYGQVRKQFGDALADPEVTSILFDIDSPGGEVAGAFDLVDEIHAARGKKPIYAVANERAFSAAYAIASAADKVYLPRTGAVGSVGVIAIHYEQSKAEAQVGIKYTAIFAGAHKNDFTMHEPLSAAARDVAQSSVDRTYDLFVATVARNRNLAADAVRAQQAGIYDGEDAVAAGLADGVMTLAKAIDHLSGKPGPSNGILAKGSVTCKRSGSATTAPNHDQSQVDQIGAEFSALLADSGKRMAAIDMLHKIGFTVAAQDAGAAGAVAEIEREAARSATGRARAIAEKSVLAGAPQLAAKLIREDVSVEAAGTRLMEHLHVNDLSSELCNFNSGIGPSGSDYVIADARRRAAGVQPKDQADSGGDAKNLLEFLGFGKITPVGE